MGFKNTGKALAIVRARLCLSQAELAESCGMGRAQISRYESGKELMKLLTLERILTRLNVKAEDFFRFVESLDNSALPECTPEDRADPLRASFEVLYSAIDGLRAGIAELREAVEPAARLARLINQAAITKGAALPHGIGVGSGQQPAPVSGRVDVDEL